MSIFFFLSVHTNSLELMVLFLTFYLYHVSSMTLNVISLAYLLTIVIFFNSLASSPTQTVPNRTIYNHTLLLLCIHDTLKWLSTSSKVP